jgi:predicted acetylornithine/succinylornithine family transaminase
MNALMQTYAPAQLEVVRGEGSWLIDATGRQYLDCISGIAVTSLGHAHPELVEALTTQAKTLWHTSNLYANTLAEPVAQEIDRLIGGGETPAGGKVFFCNSGAEANEAALKLARKAAPVGRYIAVSTWGSFHGRTLATLAATGQPAKRLGFEPLPEGFTLVDYDDLDVMANVLADPAVGALIIESIQGEGGVVTPREGYLRALRALCDEHKVLLIVDEVQTGFGRTGKWFGFHHEGILPDIVTMAKALGNGMPVGACWAQGDVARHFSPGDHGTTFGGQPLALSVVAATLSIMRRENVCTRATSRGDQLAAGLAALPGVVEVRGKGLLRAAVLKEKIAATVANVALLAGVLVNPVRDNVLRLAPSLLMDSAEIAESLQRLRRALLTVLP